MRRRLGPALVALMVAGLFPVQVLAATGPKFTVEPGGGGPGVVWGQQPQVAIKTGNNIVESATGTINLAISSGTGTPGAVLTCTATTVSLVNGVAVFAGCRINATGTNYRLIATWSQGGSDESASFNIGGGTGTKLGFVVQPARGTPGGPLAIQPSVSIQDPGGATVVGAPATTVTLALGTNPGGAIVTCTGGLSKSTVNGVAAFTGCSLDRVGVGYTVIATATALTSATSALFDVADRLAFTTQPSGAAGGIAFTTQPVVAVRAGASSTATHDSATSVALSLNAGSGAPGAILTCTGGLSKVVTNGVATFIGCAISKPGVGYTIVSTASGLTSATSAPFTVTSLTSITLTNSASVITWGGGVTLNIQFGTGGGNRSFTIERTRDSFTWYTEATLTTNASGSATYVYRPATNTYFRIRFAGAADLSAGLSNTTRTVVRQIALLRPTNGGLIKSIARNSSITFTTTVRPSRPELPKATVTFRFYRLSGGTWTLVTSRDVVIDSLGKAATTFKFTSAGSWYARSIANPTPSYNANSVWSPLERYNVR